jgi:hypothetical protein
MAGNSIIWERSGEVFYATAEAPSGEIRFHLVVERLPDQRWDWVVWRPGEPAALARHGTATSAQAAMQEAELAAR